MGGISGGFLFYHSSYTWKGEYCWPFDKGRPPFILNWTGSNTQRTSTLTRPRSFQKGIVRIWSCHNKEAVVYQQGRCPSQSLPLVWEPAVIKANIGVFLTDTKPARLSIPRGPMCLKILQDNHDCSLAGHPGRDRTLWNVYKFFFWPGMGKKGERICAQL